MALTKYKLGDLIEVSTINNNSLQYGKELIRGVNNKGTFSKPKANLSKVNLKPYKIVLPGAFVYNPSRLDLGSIAYRSETDMCIVSHLYIVFYLNEKGKERIDPMYLFMYFRRNEFYREVTFRNFGSQRPEFNFKKLSELEIYFPPIEIQRKYVAVYNALKENQKAYEKGLDDLKLVCDAKIENLMKGMPLEPIGKYITKTDIRNGENGTKNVMGVSTSKEFRLPTSKVNYDKLSNYKVVRPKEISFVQTTHNEKVFAFALNNTNEDIIVTPVNEVFYTDNSKLMPEYLAMFFKRKEFDRYARFYSWGSARETFTWNDLVNVKIPIVDLNTQKSIVCIYKSLEERKKILKDITSLLKNICPILIKGSIEEGRHS